MRLRFTKIAFLSLLLYSFERGPGGNTNMEPSVNNNPRVSIISHPSADVAYTTATQGLLRLHENNDSAYTRERLGPELEELTKAFLIFFEKYEGKGNVQQWRKELIASSSDGSS